MGSGRRCRTASLAVGISLGLAATGLVCPCLSAPQQLPSPAVLSPSTTPPPVALTAPPTDSTVRPLSITLPTALQLGNANAIDIAAATERERVAVALLDQTKVLWLPTIAIGGDYFRHDGRLQDSAGNLIDASKSSLMFGAGSGPGASAIFSPNEAIFAPLAARQIVRARQADIQAASNDTLVAVSEAYFAVQQARGELAGALDTTARTQELVRRTARLAEGLVAPVEAVRAEAELARRQQAELLARERWRVASAELLRVVRLDPTTEVEPAEPPHLRVTLVDLTRSIDDLIPIALTYRPELASQQAQVQATLALLRQEKLRPLVPSLLLRGTSTNPAGTIGAGVFAGGTNSRIGDAGSRFDGDVQLLWQLDNLGFGNRARVQQREAERRLAMVELFRIQDRVAAEVSQSYAQAALAAKRVDAAERGVKLAVESAEKNLSGLSQTRRAGDVVLLVVRPQEALAAVQALAQAYVDYYGAVADANRGQFRLYRTLGNPAQCLIFQSEGGASIPATPGK